MELKKDQLKIALPEIHDVIHILITDHNGLIYPLQRVDQLTMDRVKEANPSTSGRPVMYCVKDNQITLHPRCDKDYPKVTIDYLAPKRTL